MGSLLDLQHSLEDTLFVPASKEKMERILDISLAAQLDEALLTKAEASGDLKPGNVSSRVESVLYVACPCVKCLIHCYSSACAAAAIADSVATTTNASNSCSKVSLSVFHCWALSVNDASLA